MFLLVKYNPINSVFVGLSFVCRLGLGFFGLDEMER